MTPRRRSSRFERLQDADTLKYKELIAAGDYRNSDKITLQTVMMIYPSTFLQLKLRCRRRDRRKVRLTPHHSLQAKAVDFTKSLGK